MWLTHESEWAALVAVVLGGVQWGVATRRDLGVLTLCAAGLALVLSRGAPGFVTVGLALLALVLAAMAWIRGARAGVGRPGLVGVGLLAAAVALTAPIMARPLVSPQLLSRVVEVAVVLVGVVGAVGLPLALERPGPRRTRRRWFRKVPIVRGE